MALSLLSEPKSFDAATGVLQYNLNSPIAFYTLAGIGASSIVTEALTFIFRTQSNIRLRLTFDDATVSELSVQGMLLIEPPDGTALVLVEAKGLGLIEYFASGK